MLKDVIGIEGSLDGASYLTMQMVLHLQEALGPLEKKIHWSDNSVQGELNVAGQTLAWNIEVSESETDRVTTYAKLTLKKRAEEIGVAIIAKGEAQLLNTRILGQNEGCREFMNLQDQMIAEVHINPQEGCFMGCVKLLVEAFLRPTN